MRLLLVAVVLTALVVDHPVQCFLPTGIDCSSNRLRLLTNEVRTEQQFCSQSALCASKTGDEESFLRLVARKIRKPFSKTKTLLQGMFGVNAAVKEEIATQFESIKADATSQMAKMETLTTEAANTVESITKEAVNTIVETDVADKAKEAAEELGQAVKTMFTDHRDKAARSIDFTGKWTIVVSEEFKKIYDNYLMLLGQPSLVRSVALSIVAFTTEEMVQKNQGKELMIRGRNVRGVWERTLVSSDKESRSSNTVVTADGERVQAEAWWENGGTTHTSWMRGIQKYGGGDFESKRYLADKGKTLICESTFHPFDKSRDAVSIEWRFTKG